MDAVPWHRLARSFARCWAEPGDAGRLTDHAVWYRWRSAGEAVEMSVSGTDRLWPPIHSISVVWRLTGGAAATPILLRCLGGPFMERGRRHRSQGRYWPHVNATCP